MSRFGEDTLVGFRRYASEEQYQQGTQLQINRRSMEVSGGEDVVWQIGLNIALIVEFGTNGINDEYRQAREQVEELEREMRGE